MLINFNAYVNAYLSSNNDALIAQQRFIGDNAVKDPTTHQFIGGI